MKVNADHKPDVFTESREHIFHNYNIVESSKTDEMTDETRTVFDYDSVEVKSKSKEDVIKAVMAENYSLEDEIALINNKLIGETEEHNQEYAEYQAKRDQVKSDAKLVTE